MKMGGSGILLTRCKLISICSWQISMEVGMRKWSQREIDIYRRRIVIPGELGWVVWSGKRLFLSFISIEYSLIAVVGNSGSIGFLRHSLSLCIKFTTGLLPTWLPSPEQRHLILADFSSTSLVLSTILPCDMWAYRPNDQCSSGTLNQREDPRLVLCSRGRNGYNLKSVRLGRGF